MAFIKVNHLDRHFPMGQKKIFGKSQHMLKAVDNVTFEIHQGETVGIIGESGSGKTTLGRLLIGLDTPTSGTITINEQELEEIKKQNRKQFHRMNQMVFQNPFDTFDNRHTIYRIINDALNLHDIGADDQERKSIIIEEFNKGGLIPGEQFLYRYPHQLSGGQLQRVSIIRAMLLEPQFLVADEPVSMLDVSVRSEIIKMLQFLTTQKNTTLVFISHDIATTQFIADRLIVMYKGEVVETGKTEEIIQNPQHDYTKLLLASVMSIDPREGKRYRKERGIA